jgi:GNAT superfamily N-acetyltransferase
MGHLENTFDYIRKLPKKLFNRYRYLITLKDLDAISDTAFKSEIPLQTRLLEQEDIEAYIGLKNSNSLVAVLYRLSQGHICWCAFHDDKMVAYVWRGVDKVYVSELKTTITLPRGFYYAYEAYTVPEYRGNGVFKELLTSWNKYAKDHYGNKKSVAIVDPHNEPAVRGALATGQEIIGTIETTIFLGVPFHRVEGNVGKEDLINRIFIQKTGD